MLCSMHTYKGSFFWVGEIYEYSAGKESSRILWKHVSNLINKFRMLPYCNAHKRRSVCTISTIKILYYV